MNSDQLDLFADTGSHEPNPAPPDQAVFVVLDLETTGLNPTEDKIIEVGAVRFSWGTPMEALAAADRLDILVNPGMPISKEATDLTGISDADVIKAPPIERVVPQIREFLASATYFVAHKASFEIAFLAAADVDLGHLQVLDTRDLVVMCQPSLFTTSLPRVAPSLYLPGGGHRAFADALQTAQMLTLFLSGDYLGGLGDHALLTILRHTSQAWVYRQLFVTEALHRGIDDTRTPPRLCPEDLETKPSPESAASGAARPASDPGCEEAVTAALAAGRAQVIPVLPDQVATQSLANAILNWAGTDHRRVLVAVPALAGTGVVGSLLDATSATETDIALACLVEPARFVDLQRLDSWLAGRVLDSHPAAKDFGESRMLVKLLSWMTHIDDPGRRQLRFLNQHDMPMLALDRTVHWPSVRGHAASQTESLAPAGIAILPSRGHDFEAAAVVVADHATLIHTVLDDPEFAGDFDAIVVEDLWHLARMDAERDQESRTLAEFSYLLDRVQETFESAAGSPGAAWMRDRPELAACLQDLAGLRATAADALLSLADVAAVTASELRELDGQSNPRWPSDQSLDLCQQATAWGELVNEGRTLLGTVSRVGAVLDDLHGLLDNPTAHSEPHLACLRSQTGLLGEQIGRLAGFLEMFLARNPTAADPNVVHWVTARSANAADYETDPLERLGFNRTTLLPSQFLVEELETQTDALVLTARTTASWKFESFVADRLDIGNLPVAVHPSRPRCATLLVGPTGLDATRVNQILAELLARLYPETGECLIEGCTIVVPPPARAGESMPDPFQGLGKDLVHVAANNMAPLAIRRELLQPGPHLLTGSVRNLASLDLVGVDVRLVLITRFPFLPFSHPVQERLAQRMGSGYSGFPDYTLPEAIATVQRLVDLTQSASSGKAVAVILDPRITGKRYGQEFMDGVAADQTSAPPAAHAVSTVLDWLQA